MTKFVVSHHAMTTESQEVGEDVSATHADGHCGYPRHRPWGLPHDGKIVVVKWLYNDGDGRGWCELPGRGYWLLDTFCVWSPGVGHIWLTWASEKDTC